MVYIFVFIFGITIGSFLNVLILRYNSGESIFKGGSRCFFCSRNLNWYELIPVFSFLIQKGKCRGCGSKISWQYPLVELTTGILFVLLWNYEILNSFFLWAIFSLLIVIFVYDLRHMIIPNKVVWFFNTLAFIALFIIHYSLFIQYFLSGLAFFAFFAFLWLVSKGKWMGFGDAKLALGLGWLLGPVNTLSAFLFSFWLGGAVGIILILLAKSKISIKSKIPFAPFLIAGSLIALLLDINILNLF